MDHLAAANVDAAMTAVDAHVARLRIAHLRPAHEGIGSSQTGMRSGKAVAHQTGAVVRPGANSTPSIGGAQAGVGTAYRVAASLVGRLGNRLCGYRGSLDGLLFNHSLLLSGRGVDRTIVGLGGLLGLRARLGLSLTLGGGSGSSGLPHSLFGGGALGSLFWAMTLNCSDAAKIANLAYATPALSVLICGTVLGEGLHFSSFAGLGLILLGFFVQRRFARRQPNGR